MTIDDDLPPRQPERPASALWWMLIAAAVIGAVLLMGPEAPLRTSPAERNTMPVTQAPVLMPAEH